MTKNSISAANAECNSDPLLLSIAPVIKSCKNEQDTMIAIYHLEKMNFVFLNQMLKKKLGDQSERLMSEGWQYWYLNVNPKEVYLIRDRVKEFFSETNDLNFLSLKYHLKNCHLEQMLIRHDIRIHIVKGQKFAVNYFFDLSIRERIEKSVRSMRSGNLVSSPIKELNISKRESEVLGLIANGLSSKQIANKLFISTHTAISHRKNLIEKFQAHNTANLINRAYGMQYH